MEYQYCIFYKNDRLLFGWIKEVRKNKIVVVPEQGKEFSCSASRVEYVWKGKIITEEKEAIIHLAEMAAWVNGAFQKLDLELYHELCESGVSYSLDELAENFLDGYENGWLRATLFISLKENDKLFQQKKNNFVARTQADIQEITEREQKKQELKKRQLVEKDWVEQLLNDELPSSRHHDEAHWNHFILRLRNFLIHFEKSQEKEYFCSLFNNQMKDPESFERVVLNCLAKTNQAISWGRLILERSSANLNFDDQEQQAVEQIVNADIWESPFDLPIKDQRGIETFTVDNAETRDYDDALSWQDVESGSILNVYISDVASFIPKGSRLFEKAADRISSLYTLKGIYPMFFPELSEGLFSLKENEDRAALAFQFKLNDVGEIEETDIYRAIIRVDKNCSYQEIDQAIEEEQSFWPSLWSFCKRQSGIRQENGSLELDRIEIKLDISDPQNISIKSIRENTPASLLIQELAISSNHLAASYATENELACLFRNQPPYSITKELAEGEKPTLKDLNIQPARISLSAEGHSALGLDCYLQITSPIRRFLDLVNQSTIFSSLAGQSTQFNSDELLIWAKLCEEIQREYNLVERKLEDHWKIKYLEQNKQEIFKAYLIRYFRSGRALVNLIDLQLYLEVSIKGIEQDSEFLVTIDDVNPDLNRVVVRPVEMVEEESDSEITEKTAS